MNCNSMVVNYINNCEKNEPIFIEDIKEYIMQFYNEAEKENVYNNIKAILNRLTKENRIKTAYKGIYYIPKVNIFGEIPLAIRKIVQYKYLVDKLGNVKGYITGATLFNQVGLTTQVPNIMDKATNPLSQIVSERRMRIVLAERHRTAKSFKHRSSKPNFRDLKKEERK